MISVGSSLLYHDLPRHNPSIESPAKTMAKRPRPSLLAASSYPEDLLSVQFSEEKCVYTNLDHVVGSIEYSSSLDLTDCKLVVHLFGITHVKIDMWSRDTMAYAPRRSEWVFLKQQLPLSIDRSTAKSRFAFEIPASLQPRQCPRGDFNHLSLPPSSGSHSRPDGLFDFSSPAVEASNVYQIRVEVQKIATDEIVGHATKRFLFIPFTQSPALSETRSTYSKDAEHNRAVLSRVGTKLGLLSLSRNRQRTLFTSGISGPISTPMDLSLTFIGNRPPTITRAKMTLKALVVRRVTHAHDDTEAEYQSVSRKEISTLQFGPRGAGRWQQDGGRAKSWTLDLSLPVVLLKDKTSVVVPSFESCLISRRYVVELELGLASASKLGVQSTMFEIPVNVVALLSDQQSGAPVYYGSDLKGECLDAEMPSYLDVITSYADAAPMIRSPEYSDDALSVLERNRRPSWHDKDCGTSIFSTMSSACSTRTIELERQSSEEG